MNNNPELNNNNSADDQTTAWGEGILPRDNFYQFRQNSQEAPASELSDDEIRQRIIAERRERLKSNPEAHDSATRVTTKLLALALATTTFIGGLVAVNSDKNFLDSEQARQEVIELEDVDTIVFHGNIRSNPETTNSQDPTNIYASIDDEVTLDVPEDTKILYYSNESDPNGGWYGIPADFLAQESYLSKREARKIENDGDSCIWVNQGNASVYRDLTDDTK